MQPCLPDNGSPKFIQLDLVSKVKSLVAVPKAENVFKNAIIKNKFVNTIKVAIEFCTKIYKKILTKLCFI